MTVAPQRDDRGGELSLVRALWQFVRLGQPLVIVGLVLVALVGRLVVGQFSIWDLVIPVVCVALHPFTEWLIHVYILHFEPRWLLGRVVDLPAARRHRAHHRKPWDLGVVAMPWQDSLVGLGIGVGVSFMVAPNGAIFAAMVVSISGVTLFYEWCHFLVHTSYRPRTRWFRRLWRHHRLHHHKNENYWMGVTMFMGDRLFGTLPAHPSDVETSPTCRTLFDGSRPAPHSDRLPR